MAEPYQSNIRHFLGDPSEPWKCLLCHAVIGSQDPAMHRVICPVETRIRQIVREELAQQRSDQS